MAIKNGPKNYIMNIQSLPWKSFIRTFYTYEFKTYRLRIDHTQYFC